MKKKEALEAIPQRTSLLMEYIDQFMEDESAIMVDIQFDGKEIKREPILVTDIVVFEQGDDNDFEQKGNCIFERHLNLGITTDHVFLFFEALLTEIADKYLEHDTIGISEFYDILGVNTIFAGIDVSNPVGSIVHINFGGVSKEIVDNYNRRLEDYCLEQSITSKTRK